jgi:DNA invertase Pin-like site-specific DNA recombinase
LLQFQGMIAEYERAQILERSRRGMERVNDFDTAGGRSLGSEFWFL